MRRLRGAALVACLILSACGLLPNRTEHLRGFDQRLSSAYGSHEVIVQSVPGAIVIGHITAANGEHVIAIAKEARAALDLARTLDNAGHGLAAEESLRLGSGVLSELDEFLKRQRPTSLLKEMKRE